MRALVLAALLALAGACVEASAGGGAPDASARVWPVRVLHVGAAAFAGDSSFGVMSQAGYLYPAGATIAYAPVPLPAGTYLASVTVYYLVGGGFVRPALRRMDPATGEISPVWLGAFDGDGAAIESQGAALGASMTASEVYWVECMMTAPANRLYGAVIEYVEAMPL